LKFEVGIKKMFLNWGYVVMFNSYLFFKRLYVFSLVLFTVFSLCFVTSTLVFAEVPVGTVAEGCNPKVMDALKAKADAKVAYDVAVTEELVDKPDSVLAMTCFEKSAEVGAETVGGVFSGGFSADLSAGVNAGLEAHYDNFKEGTADARSVAGGENSAYNLMVSGGQFNGSITLNTGNGAAPSFDCDAMDKMWKDSNKEGVRDTPSFSDVANPPPAPPPQPGQPPTAPPPAETDFEKSIEASSNDQQVFQNLKDKTDQLPVHDVPDFADDDSPCQVLLKAGTYDGDCP